jgi:cytochrome c5
MVPRAMIVFGCLMLLTACESKQAPTTALTPDLQAGKALVEANCVVCHKPGINGAPIIGNPKMWQRRIAQGQDVLVQHAIDGYNYDMMPPRGGNPELSDNDIRLAVAYLVSQVKDH